jgi:hypothetical protein
MKSHKMLHAIEHSHSVRMDIGTRASLIGVGRWYKRRRRSARCGAVFVVGLSVRRERRKAVAWWHIRSGIRRKRCYVGVS